MKEHFIVSARTSSEYYNDGREYPSKASAEKAAKALMETWWIGAVVTIYRKVAGADYEPVWTATIK